MTMRDLSSAAPTTRCTRPCWPWMLPKRCWTRPKPKGCDLVITHHPIVFRALKRFNSADPVERCVERAIRSRIALYACHTNLDSAPGGMSWRLAEMLGVGNLRVLQPSETGDGAGFGVVGELPEAIDTVEFMRIIQRRLEVSVIRYSDIATSGVRRVAVCTGAGASLIGEARRAGADIYITCRPEVQRLHWRPDQGPHGGGYRSFRKRILRNSINI